MNKIDLQYLLKGEQEYVLDYFSGRDDKIAGFKYNKSTDTCYEKSQLLQEEGLENWNPEQVVKAVYLWDKNSKFYLFVSPELGTKKNPLKFDQNTLSKIFRKEEYSSKTRGDLLNLKSNGLPFGVEEGTCSPFVPEHYFELGDGYNGFLEKIFVYDSPKLDKKKVDISLGGDGDFFHKVSAHLNYEDIYGCLNSKFKEGVEKFTF